MKINVLRYTSDLESDWATVLADSKNSLFLFDRDYIAYHGERFVDFSAIAYLDGKPAALLPATIDKSEGHAQSHPGLTFGGVALRRDLRSDAAIALVNMCLDLLKAWGATTLTIRMVPPFLWSYPAAELDYALWLRGFASVRRDLSSVLPLAGHLAFNASKKQGIAKAMKSGLIIGEGSLREFHALLSATLRERHGVAPVHSLKELMLLNSLFPKKIFLRSAAHGGVMLAGVLIYRYPTAWHTQYMAASKRGRELGALDGVIASAIDEATVAGANFFSFGVSTELNGRNINKGLLWQKESFGARSVVHDFMSGCL